MKKRVVYVLGRAIVDEDTGKIVKRYPARKLYVDPGKDYHDSFGVLKKELLVKDSFEAGKDSFAAFDASFADLLDQIKRGAQIVTAKDLGAVVAHTGMNKESLVLDSGSGSGSAACFFAAISKRVDSFDVNDENLDVSRKNALDLGLGNVSFSKGDVYDSSGFKEAEYDIFFLDVPEPKNAFATASKTLKKGGFFVIYVPNANQLHEAVNNLPKEILFEQAVEIIERDWSVKEKVLRPATKDFGHTAFLCFARKIL